MINFKKQTIFTFIISFGLVLTIIILTYGYLLKKNNRTECPNVLLITIDALRADHLSCYGYKRDTSPHIDNLAKEGVIFTQAISQGSATIPSLPSLMTSFYPSQLGVRSINERSFIFVSTLAEILRKNNYYTGAIIAHELEHTGINKGFNFIDSNFSDLADTVTQKAVAWLKKNKDKKFFLWLHYFDPHEPFLPIPPYDEIFLPTKFKEKGKETLAREYSWILINEPPPTPNPLFEEKNGLGQVFIEPSAKRPIPPFSATAKQSLNNSLTEEDRAYYISQYDGEIKFTDDQIGILFDELKRLGLDGKALIILSADHGENLADYNKYFRHGDSLYDILLKVPLIIKYSKLPKNKSIKRQVQLIDVMPTIFDILGIKRNIKIEGVSLLSLILGKKRKIRDYAFSEIFGATHAKSIRTEDWKLIYYLNKDKYELYNLKSDPQEQHNLVDLEKEEFKFLQTKLEKWMRRVGAKKPFLSRPLDEETKQKLRSLGYMQ